MDRQPAVRGQESVRRARATGENRKRERVRAMRRAQHRVAPVAGGEIRARSHRHDGPVALETGVVGNDLGLGTVGDSARTYLPRISDDAMELPPA